MSIVDGLTYRSATVRSMKTDSALDRLAAAARDRKQRADAAMAERLVAASSGQCVGGIILTGTTTGPNDIVNVVCHTHHVGAQVPILGAWSWWSMHLDTARMIRTCVACEFLAAAPGDIYCPGCGSAADRSAWVDDSGDQHDGTGL